MLRSVFIADLSLDREDARIQVDVTSHVR